MNKCILKFYRVIVLACCLAGCAPLTEQSTVLNQPIPWQDRAAKLAAIQAWNINAVMAVQTQAGSEGGSAHLQWQQHQQNYTILLFGPFGANAIRVSGRPGNVSLETADGKKISAISPERLLMQQAGWQLPVSNLYYWIRGLPVPGMAARKQFDRYHHLVRLYQQGWTVDFLRYSAVTQVDVPVKISLQNWRMRVKIIINQWQLYYSD